MKWTTRSALILAGDIGGTKTRLGLYRVSETTGRLLTSSTYPSKAYRVMTLTVPLPDVERALLDGETDGFARVHLKASR